jgi:hypothetical protein
LSARVLVCPERRDYLAYVTAKAAMCLYTDADVTHLTGLAMLATISNVWMPCDNIATTSSRDPIVAVAGREYGWRREA